jgi:hypothetical protein
VSSYDGATLKVTDLFSKAILLPIFVWKLHGYVLDVIHLSAMGVAEIVKSTNVKVSPHTFVYIVYILRHVRQHNAMVANIDRSKPFFSLKIILLAHNHYLA